MGLESLSAELILYCVRCEFCGKVWTINIPELRVFCPECLVKMEYHIMKKERVTNNYNDKLVYEQ